MQVMEQLRSNPLFHGVSDETLREARRVVVPNSLNEGEVLLFQDRDGEMLHLLVKGALRVSKLGIGQLERTLGELYSPAVVGETALLMDGERSATVTAILPGLTFSLHRHHLEMLAKREPQLLWNLARILAERVRDLNDELIAYGHSTDAALAHILRGQYAQRVRAGLPDPTKLPLTHGDLMIRLSASRETVSRVMRRFQKMGIIAVSDSKIVLLDPQLLETYDPEEE